MELTGATRKWIRCLWLARTRPDPVDVARFETIPPIPLALPPHSLYPLSLKSNMEVSISSSPVISSTVRKSFGGIRVADRSQSFANRICKSGSDRLNGKAKLKWKINAVDGVSAAADPGQAEVTWQIAVGAIGILVLFIDLIRECCSLIFSI